MSKHKPDEGEVMISMDGSWMALPTDPAQKPINITQSMDGIMLKMLGPETLAQFKHTVRQAGQHYLRNQLK